MTDNIIRKITDNIVVCDLTDIVFFNKNQSNIGSNDHIDQIVNDCKKIMINGGTIVGSIRQEMEPVDEWFHRIEYLHNIISDNRYTFILVYPECAGDLNADFKTIAINYNLGAYWFAAINAMIPGGYITKWDKNNEKFLLLTGKPDKRQRLRLLYKFYNANLLDKFGVWSLIVPDKETAHNAQYIMSELSDEEYYTFIDNYTTSPDNLKPATIYNYTETLHFPVATGSNIDNILLNVVSETTMQHRLPFVYVSEKTWRAIINHQPFIIAGDTGLLDYLEKKGYNTFREYLKYPEYNNVESSELKMDMIVDNVADWYENKIYEKFSLEIEKDINTNFEKTSFLAQQDISKLNQLNKFLGLDGYTAYDLINFSQVRENKWLEFYDNIKDESWPQCIFEETFVQLPKEIQQECMEVYGYDPKNPINEYREMPIKENNDD